MDTMPVAITNAKYAVGKLDRSRLKVSVISILSCFLANLKNIFEIVRILDKKDMYCQKP